MSVIIIIFMILVIAILLMWTLSRMIYKRSLMATLVEFYLKVSNRKVSDEEVANTLCLLPKVNDIEYTLPKGFKINCEYVESKFSNMKYYILNCNASNKSAIIYMHGAGYVRQPRLHHWKFVIKLAKKTGLKVIMPIYPKAPNHCCEEVYPLMTEFYKKIANENEKVIFMGDSSGGGFALGLTESFKENGIKMPEQLILFSPWVDVELNNPDIVHYQKVDPFISASNEKIWGKAWAKNLSVDDWRVSPINGQLSNLKNVTLFVGTREILYPDVIRLYEKLEQNGSEVTIHIGKGLNHVYPIYPIWEAHKTLNLINRIIQRKGK